MPFIIPEFLEIYSSLENESSLEKRKKLFVYKVILLWTSIHKRPPAILDLGSGRGLISGPLASFAQKVVGLDLQEEAVSSANIQFGSSKCQYVQGDLNEFLRRCEDKFDIILCLEVLEHLLNPTKTLSLVRRICYSRSLVLVSIPNGYGPYQIFFDLPAKTLHKVLELIGLLNPYSQGTKHLISFSGRIMRKVTSITGFEILWRGNAYVLGFVPGPLSKLFSIFDAVVTDRIHPWFVSGWYYVLGPKS